MLVCELNVLYRLNMEMSRASDVMSCVVCVVLYRLNMEMSRASDVMSCVVCVVLYRLNMEMSRASDVMSCVVFVVLYRLNMEMSRASDVMSCPVETIHCKEIVANLACLLLNTSHSAFPVVKFDTETKKELAYGLITRYLSSLSLLNLFLLKFYNSFFNLKWWRKLYRISLLFLYLPSLPRTLRREHSDQRKVANSYCEDKAKITYLNLLLSLR